MWRNLDSVIGCSNWCVLCSILSSKATFDRLALPYRLSSLLTKVKAGLPLSLTLIISGFVCSYRSFLSALFFCRCTMMMFQFFLCSVILADVVIAAVAPVYARSNPPQCKNFAQALSILESLQNAKAFCFPIVYPDGVPTKTKSTVITVTSATCSTKTKTSTVRTIFTDR